MKTRETHIGGWRWRLRTFPWDVAAAVTVCTILLIAAVFLAVAFLTAESAS